MEQQSEQPVQEKMESKLPIKRNWKLLVIVVVFAILVSGGTIWFTQYSKPTPSQTISTPKTPSPRQQQIDTSTWQTYRNDEFGFEVKYPEVFAKSGGCKPRQIDSATVAVGNRITIEIRDSEGRTLEVYVNDLLSKLKEQFSPEAVMNEIKKSSAQLGNMPAAHIAWGSLGYHLIETRYAVKDGRVYLVNFSAGPNCSVADESGISEESVLNQILSTFRFIDEKATVPKDKQTCESRGGNWGRFGLAQMEGCNMPTSDAGKTCTDSSQCESVCITDDHTLFDAEAKGYCYGWTQTLGTCLNYIKNGKAQGTLCLD